METALEGAEGETALDLYAGVGLFSLPLARRFAAVTAVESGARAAGDLQFNAERAGLALRVRKDGAEAFLESWRRAPDFVLLDPPRAGIGKRRGASGCATAAAEAGHGRLRPGYAGARPGGPGRRGYQIERLTLVDLFPQTYHLETVAHLAL